MRREDEEVFLSEPTADALQRVADPKRPEAERLSLIETVGQSGKAECVPVLLKVLTEVPTDPLRRAALSALSSKEAIEEIIKRILILIVPATAAMWVFYRRFGIDVYYGWF